MSSSSASAAAAAAAASEVTVQGDLSAVLSEVDAVVSREDAAPKDVADAAMALAYLQARGDRRYVGAWCMQLRAVGLVQLGQPGPCDISLAQTLIGVANPVCLCKGVDVCLYTSSITSGTHWRKLAAVAAAAAKRG